MSLQPILRRSIYGIHTTITINDESEIAHFSADYSAILRFLIEGTLTSVLLLDVRGPREVSAQRLANISNQFLHH